MHYDDENDFFELNRDFEKFRPVMTFFQTAPLKNDFSEFDDDISEILTSLDHILQCDNPKEAAKHFMSFNKIRVLIEKLLEYYCENVRMLKFMDI